MNMSKSSSTKHREESSSTSKDKSSSTSKDKSRSASKEKSSSVSKDKSSSGRSSRDHRDRDRGRKPKSRSRSPRRRSRSSSPKRRRYSGGGTHRNGHGSSSTSYRRRSKSPDPIAEFLERTNKRRSRSKSPYNPFAKSRSRSRSPNYAQHSKRKENELFREKLTLTAEGKWNAELEKNWKAMEREEILLSQSFKDYRQKVKDKPEDHPKYSTEWADYWEKEHDKVRKSGKDPDSYDYIPGWKVFWSKRVQLLIDIEYGAACEQVRRKHRMDLQSLRKLANNSNSNAIPNSIIGNNTLNYNEEFHDVLCNPEPPRPPRTSFVPNNNLQNDSIIQFPESQSKSESIIEARPPEADTTPKAPVTVKDIKSTWESLTGSLFGEITHKKTTDSAASTPSTKPNESTDQEPEFDGLNLFQVLQMVSGLEDQLSFLSAKVQDYLKEAEELDSQSPKKSYYLLDNEDFVSLLLQCRDRFSSLIRANILHKDILKTLNLSVYMVNLVLSSPRCQKTSTNIEKKAKLKRESIRQYDPSLTVEQKREIINLITTNLIAMGQQISGLDLPHLIFNLIQALLPEKTKNGQSTNEVKPSNRDLLSSMRRPRRVIEEPEPDKPKLSLPVPDTQPYLRGSLPPLPRIEARAASPPRPVQNFVHYQQIPDSVVNRINYDDYP